MAHTPGPWRIENGEPFDYPSPSRKRHKHTIVGTGEGTLGEPFRHVADCGYAGADEVRSNARLIAAAPDLLWLAERAKAIHEATNWTKAERERSWADWAEHARAAIAKVEGQ